MYRWMHWWMNEWVILGKGGQKCYGSMYSRAKLPPSPPPPPPPPVIVIYSLYVSCSLLLFFQKPFPSSFLTFLPIKTSRPSPPPLVIVIYSLYLFFPPLFILKLFPPPPRPPPPLLLLQQLFSRPYKATKPYQSMHCVLLHIHRFHSLSHLCYPSTPSPTRLHY